MVPRFVWVCVAVALLAWSAERVLFVVDWAAWMKCERRCPK